MFKSRCVMPSLQKATTQIVYGRELTVEFDQERDAKAHREGLQGKIAKHKS